MLGIAGNKNDADLIPNNVRNNINILGVNGNLITNAGTTGIGGLSGTLLGTVYNSSASSVPLTIQSLDRPTYFIIGSIYGFYIYSKTLDKYLAIAQYSDSTFHDGTPAGQLMQAINSYYEDAGVLYINFHSYTPADSNFAINLTTMTVTFNSGVTHNSGTLLSITTTDHIVYGGKTYTHNNFLFPYYIYGNKGITTWISIT